MSTSYNQPTTPRFNKSLLALAVAGLLAAPAFAQNDQQSQQGDQQAQQNPGTQEAPRFRDMDQDQDDLLVWREIYVVMDPRIVAANLDQEQIFNEYDSDGDDALDPQEFDDFLSGLEEREIASGERQMRQDSQEMQAITSRRNQAESRQGDNQQQNNQLATSESAHGADQAMQLPEDSRYNTPGGTSSAALRQNQANNQGRSEDADLIQETEYLTDQSEQDNNRSLATQSSQRDQGTAGHRRPGDNTSASASGETAGQQEDAEYLSGNSPTVDDPGDSMNTESNQRDQYAAGDRRPGDNTSASSAQNLDQQGSQRGSTSTDALSSADDSAQSTDRNVYPEYTTVEGEDGTQSDNAQAATIESGSAYERENNMDATASIGSSGEQDLQSAPISSLQKKTVTNSAGEELGEVRDVVVNRERGEVGFVVSSGGVMGIGSKKILAPADELSLSQDNIVWDTDKNTQELRESAKYRSDGYEEISDQYETIEEARQAGL